MSADWHQLQIHTSPSWANKTITAFVRAWEPGDGLRCAAAGKSQRIPCDKPVAVIKEIHPQNGRSCRPDSVTAAFLDTSDRSLMTVTRVLCCRHLARRIDPALGNVISEDQADKRALEELAERYWDQYVTIRARIAQELLNARYAGLPKDLRDKIIAIQAEFAEETGL